MAQENIQVTNPAEKVADLPLDRKIYSLNLSPLTEEKCKKIMREWLDLYVDVHEKVVNDVNENIVQEEIESRYIDSAAKIINKEDEMWVLVGPKNGSDEAVESVDSRAIRLIRTMIEGCKKNSEKIYNSGNKNQTEPNTEVITIPEAPTPLPMPNDSKPSMAFIELPKQQVLNADDNKKADDEVKTIGEPIVNDSVSNENGFVTRVDYSDKTISLVTDSQNPGSKDMSISEAVDAKLKGYIDEQDVSKKKYVPMTDEQIANSQKNIGVNLEIEEAEKLRQNAATDEAIVAQINATKGYEEPNADTQIRDNSVVVPEREKNSNVFSIEPEGSKKEELPKYTMASDITADGIEKINTSEEKADAEEKGKESVEDVVEPTIVATNTTTKAVVVSPEYKDKLSASNEDLKKKINDAMAEKRKLKEESSSIDQNLKSAKDENDRVIAAEKKAIAEMEFAKRDRENALEARQAAYEQALETINNENAGIAMENQRKTEEYKRITKETASILQNIDNVTAEASKERAAAEQIRNEVSELNDMFAKSEEKTGGVEYKR